MTTRTYGPINLGNQYQNKYHETIVALAGFMVAKEEVADNSNVSINAPGNLNTSKPAGFQTTYNVQIRAEVFTGNHRLVQTTQESLIAAPSSASSANVRIPGAFSGVQEPSGLTGNMQPRINSGRVEEGSRRNALVAFNQFFGESSESRPIHGGMALANLESEQDGYVLTWEVNIIYLMEKKVIQNKIMLYKFLRP